jgi:hypothetical protein
MDAVLSSRSKSCLIMVDYVRKGNGAGRRESQHLLSAFRDGAFDYLLTRRSFSCRLP